MNDNNLNKIEIVESYIKRPEEFIFQWHLIIGHAMNEMENNPKTSASAAIKSHKNEESLRQDRTNIGIVSACKQKILYPAYDEYEEIFWKIRWKGEVLLFGLRTCAFSDGSIVYFD